MSAAATKLAEHYAAIGRERMRDLPFFNERLVVEAVGFRRFEEHEIGILISPWFMNLVLLPGTDAWRDRQPGSLAVCSLPQGDYEFTVCHDHELGTHLSAVLFRTVVDFPDQATARAIAADIMRRLFAAAPGQEAGKLSRRDLVTGMGAS